MHNELPMQQTLRNFQTYIILLLSVFLILSTAGIAWGQVLLVDENPIEVRFAKETSQITGSGVTLSLSELSRFMSADPDADLAEWNEYNPGTETAGHYFIPDEGQYVAAGVVSSDGTTGSDEFISLGFKNEANFHVSGMMVAFDFIYNRGILQNNYTLRLNYRVNGGNWKRASGGTLQTSMLGRTEDEWSTFSLQLNLNDIYLRNGDQIELKWELDEQDQVNNHLPLAIQKIEAFPEKSIVKNLGPGSIIITEILPGTKVDDLDFEYVELYNPGESPVTLKGVEMVTNMGEVVIQRDIEIAPYDVILFSNVDVSGFEGITNNYVYDGSLIPSNGGRIEFLYHEQTIAGATYEPSEPGVALELNNALNAHDGYTSMQHLIPAENSFIPDLTGSPGSLGSTAPFYKKTLRNEGWYFMTPPGEFIDRFSRNSSLEFYGLNGERTSVELLEPGSPVFIKKLDDNPVTVVVQGQHGFNREEIATINMGQRVYMGSFTSPDETALRNLTRDGDTRLAPVVKIWNEQQQRFNLVRTDQERIENWSPFVMNPGMGDNIDVNPRAPKAAPALERFISFSLFEGSSGNRKLVDEALLGFLEIPAYGSDDVRFDLPKLTATFQSQLSLKDQSLLYLNSAESSDPANGFLHLPYQIETSYQVGLGYEQGGTVAREASLAWSIPDEIPDEWILTLEDRQTGATINMREENSYRFRNSGNQPTELEEEFSGLTVLIPKERNRFVVNVEPYEQLIEEEEEDERPGTVELRQNYPNPFNPSTNISFYLPEERPVRVGVYNIVGQQVSLLIDDTIQAGEHSVIWDATNHPSGIYIVQLETGSRILTRKITLIK